MERSLDEAKMTISSLQASLEQAESASAPLRTRAEAAEKKLAMAEEERAAFEGRAKAAEKTLQMVMGGRQVVWGGSGPSALERPQLRQGGLAGRVLQSPMRRGPQPGTGANRTGWESTSWVDWQRQLTATWW